jgi:hypothetical protein
VLQAIPADMGFHCTQHFGGMTGTIKKSPWARTSSQSPWFCGLPPNLHIVATHQGFRLDLKPWKPDAVFRGGFVWLLLFPENSVRAAGPRAGGDPHDSSIHSFIGGTATVTWQGAAGSYCRKHGLFTAHMENWTMRRIMPSCFPRISWPRWMVASGSSVRERRWTQASSSSLRPNSSETDDHRHHAILTPTEKSLPGKDNALGWCHISEVPRRTFLVAHRGKVGVAVVILRACELLDQMHRDVS